MEPTEITPEVMTTKMKQVQEDLKKNLNTMIVDLEGKIREGEIEGKGVADLKEQVSKIATDTAEKSDEFAKLAAEWREEKAGIKEELDALKKKNENLPTFGEEPFWNELAEKVKAAGMGPFEQGKRIAVPIKSGFMGEKRHGMKDTSVSGATVYAPQYRPGIIPAGQRQLRIRDLMPILPTTAATVYFPKENSVTDNAQSQDGQGVTKGETSFVIGVGSETVQTVAHFSDIPTQMLDDIPGLQGYINSRMLFLLDQEVEDQLISGTGSNSQLNGLVTQATAYDTTLDNDMGVSNVQDLDRIRVALAQVEVGSDFAPDAVVLHPYDWASMELLKDSQNRYLFSSPQDMSNPRVWGLPVVATKGISSGQFLVGAFAVGAAIWDRMQAQIAISTENSTNFEKNLATIRAERRLALTVYRTLAFVEGSLDVTVT